MTHKFYSVNPEKHVVVDKRALAELIANATDDDTNMSAEDAILLLYYEQPQPVQSVTAERVRELVDDYAASLIRDADNRDSSDAEIKRGLLDATIDQMAVDAERWKVAESVYLGCDFEYDRGDKKPVPVLILSLPEGIHAGAALCISVDEIIAARAAQLPKPPKEK